MVYNGYWSWISTLAAKCIEPFWTNGCPLVTCVYMLMKIKWCEANCIIPSKLNIVQR